MKANIIRTVQHARRAVTCANCNVTVQPGMPYVWLPGPKATQIVGCLKPECSPKKGASGVGVQVAAPVQSVAQATRTRKQRTEEPTEEKLSTNNAIAVLEQRGYEVQYIGKGLYQVQPTRGTQSPSYYAQQDLTALAEMTKLEMLETVKFDQHHNPYVFAAQQEILEPTEDADLPYTRDELLIVAEDFLRVQCVKSMDPVAFIKDYVPNCQRKNLGRWVDGLAWMVQRLSNRQAVAV